MKRGACHNTNLVLAVRKVSRAYTDSCAVRRTFYIISAGATKRTEHRRGSNHKGFLNNIMNRTAAKNYNSYDKFLYSNDLKGYDN